MVLEGFGWFLVASGGLGVPSGGFDGFGRFRLVLGFGSFFGVNITYNICPYIHIMYINN